MTASEYADLIIDAAQKAGQHAQDLANAYDLARALDDDIAAAGYLGQVKGINIVLDIINDKLGDSHD